jgi:hypothetical protein
MNTLIVIGLGAISLFGLGLAYNIDANDIKSYAGGTSFQGHSESKYFPIGAGGYGPPESLDLIKKAEPTE